MVPPAVSRCGVCTNFRAIFNCAYSSSLHSTPDFEFSSTTKCLLPSPNVERKPCLLFASYLFSVQWIDGGDETDSTLPAYIYHQIQEQVKYYITIIAFSGRFCRSPSRPILVEIVVVWRVVLRPVAAHACVELKVRLRVPKQSAVYLQMMTHTHIASVFEFVKA